MHPRFTGTVVSYERLKRSFGRHSIAVVVPRNGDYRSQVVFIGLIELRIEVDGLPVEVHTITQLIEERWIDTEVSRVLVKVVLHPGSDILLWVRVLNASGVASRMEDKMGRCHD